MGGKKENIKNIGYCSIIMFFNQNYVFNVFLLLILHCWFGCKINITLSLTLSLNGYHLLRYLTQNIFWLIHLIKQRILLKFQDLVNMNAYPFCIKFLKPE